MIIYYTYSWTPPEMSASERVGLGKAISAVGRAAFSKALKNRLMNMKYKHTSWTLEDVFNDVRNPTSAYPIYDSTKGKLAVGALAAGMGAIFLTVGAPLLVPSAVVAPVTGGSYWWTAKKIDRWVQSVVDEYATSSAGTALNRVPQ